MTAGQKFGQLEAIAFKEKRGYNKYWTFKCQCGKLTITRPTLVINGHTRSCGCARKKFWRRVR